VRKKSVEIYSERSNAVVMRHPGRKYPGVLLQGDTLNSLFNELDGAIRELDGGNISEAKSSVDFVRDTLLACVNQYKEVLREHEIELPFADQESLK